MDNESDMNNGDSEAKLTCTCNVCSTELEFEDSEVGKTVPCPHCGMETVLFCNKPKPGTEPAPPVEKVPEIVKAKLVVTQGNNPDDMESKLDSAAEFFGFVVLTGVVLVFVSLFVFSNSIELGMYCLFFAISSIVGGIITRTIFLAAAEHIRLMKKSNGMRYSGDITQPESRYMCSNCDKFLPEPAAKCENCGALFDSADS